MYVQIWCYFLLVFCIILLITKEKIVIYTQTYIHEKMNIYLNISLYLQLHILGNFEQVWAEIKESLCFSLQVEWKKKQESCGLLFNFLKFLSIHSSGTLLLELNSKLTGWKMNKWIQWPWECKNPRIWLS